MNSTALRTTSSSASGLWTARILLWLDVLFMLFDAYGKIARPRPVLEAMARLGVPNGDWAIIGLSLAAIVVIYAIPKTRVLGAVLMTAYLGGAVATQLRAGSPAFETFFPIIMGIITWVPVYLLDSRVRELLPFSS